MILGEYAKAIQHFETWTLAMPRDAQAFVHLASCQARMGKDSAVIFALEQSLQAGLNEVFLIEQDTILRQFIQSKSRLAMNLSSVFWGSDNAWTALIQNAQEQSDQSCHITFTWEWTRTCFHAEMGRTI